MSLEGARAEFSTGKRSLARVSFHRERATSPHAKLLSCWRRFRARGCRSLAGERLVFLLCFLCLRSIPFSPLPRRTATKDRGVGRLKFSSDGRSSSSSLANLKPPPKSKLRERIFLAGNSTVWLSSRHINHVLTTE